MFQRKILLADDEGVFTTKMEKLLGKMGYWTKSVNSGDGALRELAKQDFDVVILDLRMYGLDGMTTLREIKNLGISTQVIILTGHGSIGTAKEAMMLGVYDYLTKPCGIEELVEKIEEACREKEKNAQMNQEKNINKIIKAQPSAFHLNPKK